MAGSEEIALCGEGVDQTARVGGDEDQRAPEAESIDLQRTRGETSVERQIVDRRHDERHDGEEQHGPGIVGGGAMKLLRAPSQSADEKGQPEHEQQVADDAAGDRRLDQLDMAFVQSDERDDQLGRVAERRVEKAAPSRPRPSRELFGAKADEAGERYQRDGGRDENPGRAGRRKGEHPGHGRDRQQQVEPVVDERA